MEKLLLLENKKHIGEVSMAFVLDSVKKDFFVARNSGYGPIPVKSWLGKFVKVEINEFFVHFFKGEIQ